MDQRRATFVQTRDHPPHEFRGPDVELSGGGHRVNQRRPTFLEHHVPSPFHGGAEVAGSLHRPFGPPPERPGQPREVGRGLVELHAQVRHGLVPPPLARDQYLVLPVVVVGPVVVHHHHHRNLVVRRGRKS